MHMDKAADWKKFVALINAADENIDSNYKPRSETALAMAFEVLKQYPLTSVARAVYKLMAESPYKIKPADIVREICGTSEDRSAIAWQTFKKAIGRHGSFDSVIFPDAAYHYAIIKMGGWEQLAKEYEQLSDKELAFKEKTWRQIYETGLNVASFEPLEDGKVGVPRYLMGECERNNRSLRYEINDITPLYDVESGRRIVGDEMRAITARPGRRAEALADGIAHSIALDLPRAIGGDAD